MKKNSDTTIRVLQITASSAIGGGPEHVWQLVEHLPQKILFFIAAPSCAPYGKRFLESAGEKNFFIIPQRKFSFIAFCKLLIYIKKNNIDIIHSHGKGAGIVGRLAAFFLNVKSIHTFHGIHLSNNIILKNIYIFFERILCRISCLCISVSHSEEALIRQLSITNDNLILIENGVKLAEAPHITKIPSPFPIVHISRFDTKQKNSLKMYYLAKALQSRKITKKYIFIIIGEGEQLPELKQLVHRGGMENSFIFYESQLAVRPFLRNAGCIVSTSRWEGLPLAILEAQSEGVPALVSDVVGNREAIVDGVTGFTFPLDDLEYAADKMATLMENEDLWLTMSHAARERIEKNFNVVTMAQSIAEQYTKVKFEV